MDQVVFIGTSMTRVTVSKKTPNAEAGARGAPFALTAPSPSPSTQWDRELAWVRSEGGGSLGQRLWQPLLRPTLKHLPCGLYWRWERQPQNFPLEQTAKKPIICLRRWEAVGTSPSASKDPPFWMKFRSP